MTLTDFLVFFGYLLALLALGAATAGKARTRAEFLIAGRSLGWLPVGVSIMASLFSAVNFIGFSGEVMSNSLYVLLVLPAYVVVAVPVLAWVIPFYVNGGGMSAYGYLERRFDARVRLLASAMFLVWRITWLAVILYAPCSFLAPILEVDYRLLALAAGAAVTIYTASGGMRAVIWNDVAHVAVIFVSVAAAIVFALGRIGGINALLASAPESGLLKPFYPADPGIWSFDPRVRMTVWSCITGGTVAFLARYGADQMIVQRYIAARSLKQARIGFAVNIALALGILLLLAFMGIAAQACCRDAHAFKTPAAGLAVFFASLPPGLLGLLAAGMAASSMSSMDAGIHSCGAAITTDFLREDRKADASPAVDRRVIVVLGAAVTVLSMFVGKLGSLFEIANRIINGLGSPLLAFLLVSAISRRVTARGMFYGGIAGLAASIAVGTMVENLSLHYYAVVNLLVTMALCLLLSGNTPALSADRDTASR